jgi:hypothetical protein
MRIKNSCSIGRSESASPVPALVNNKIKTPTLNRALCQLNVAQMVGGAKSTFCVTVEGRVYAMGDPADGLLGIDPNVLQPASPQQPGFAQKPQPHTSTWLSLFSLSTTYSSSSLVAAVGAAPQQQPALQQGGGVTERADTLVVLTLVSALANITIRKVAVNPSGAFAMALAATGLSFVNLSYRIKQ